MYCVAVAAHAAHIVSSRNHATYRSHHRTLAGLRQIVGTQALVAVAVAIEGAGVEQVAGLADA